MPLIAECLHSLSHQTFKDFSVIVVDNASSDYTVSFIKKHYPSVLLLKNTKNRGFARAHNQAIRLSRSPYVCVLNDDVVLDMRFLEEAVSVLRKHKEVGSVSGKIYQWNSGFSDKEEVREDIFLTGKKEHATIAIPAHANVIDSTGISLKRTFRFYDRGQGEEDRGQYDEEGEIFGPSGAAAFYRRDALESVRFEDEYFDELFHSYKEDVDLAWRLQRVGWKSWYTPRAVAYHRRSSGSGSGGMVEIQKERRKRNILINRLSYRNHLFMLIKHITFSHHRRFLPWVVGYEILKAGFLSVFEPKTVFSVKEIVRYREEIMRRRKHIQRYQYFFSIHKYIR